jgi:hypothetical protein
MRVLNEREMRALKAASKMPIYGKRGFIGLQLARFPAGRTFAVVKQFPGAPGDHLRPQIAAFLRQMRMRRAKTPSLSS